MGKGINTIAVLSTDFAPESPHFACHDPGIENHDSNRGSCEEYQQERISYPRCSSGYDNHTENCLPWFSRISASSREARSLTVPKLKGKYTWGRQPWLDSC